MVDFHRALLVAVLILAPVEMVPFAPLFGQAYHLLCPFLVLDMDLAGVPLHGF